MPDFSQLHQQKGQARHHHHSSLIIDNTRSSSGPRFTSSRRPLATLFSLPLVIRHIHSQTPQRHGLTITPHHTRHPLSLVILPRALFLPPSLLPSLHVYNIGSPTIRFVLFLPSPASRSLITTRRNSLATTTMSRLDLRLTFTHTLNHNQSWVNLFFVEGRERESGEKVVRGTGAR